MTPLLLLGVPRARIRLNACPVLFEAAHTCPFHSSSRSTELPLRAQAENKQIVEMISGPVLLPLTSITLESLG